MAACYKILTLIVVIIAVVGQGGRSTAETLRAHCSKSPRLQHGRQGDYVNIGYYL